MDLFPPPHAMQPAVVQSIDIERASIYVCGTMTVVVCCSAREHRSQQSHRHSSAKDRRAAAPVCRVDTVAGRYNKYSRFISHSPMFVENTIRLTERSMSEEITKFLMPLFNAKGTAP